MSTALMGSFTPFDQFRHSGSKVDDPDYFPDIIEFVLSPRYLNRPLYPRQATLLKLIFLELDLFTDYDFEVCAKWMEGGFALNEDIGSSDTTTLTYQGDWGIPPDTFERIRYLRARGYRWFAIVLVILGRRSGKGYIGALCAAYVLWYYMMLADARDHFGIARDKRLALQVFAGQKQQARDNQWRDIANVILGAKCFEEYISTALMQSLTVFSPHDLITMYAGGRVESAMDQATYEITPQAATKLSGRGPASIVQFYDEMAHMVQTSGGLDKAEDVYESATPALSQVRGWSFIYSGSSPYTMTGKFYELAQQALQVEADTRKPVYPGSFVIQLESWNIYEDWERTLVAFPARPAIIKMRPYDFGEKEYPEITFPRLKKAIQAYDDELRQKERANKDTFRVEYRSKWATAMDAYFDEEHVRRMFKPFLGEMLHHQPRGTTSIDYVAHGDPGKTSSNFGFAIGHKVYVPGSDLPHVVFDVIKAWTPQDFEDGMDYIAIEEDLCDYIDNFMPVSLSFDQWNSLGMVQRLGKHARRNQKATRVRERSATAPLNWRTAETMKTAMSLDLLHAPIHDLFELECLFLRKLPGDKVDHPDVGPVTTKDVYDACSIVIHELIGVDVANFMSAQLSALSVSPGMPGLNAPDNEVIDRFNKFTNDRLSGGRGRPRGAPSPLPRRPRR